MAKNKKRETNLAKQMADFKKENPKVAEAMELFGITLTKYQETLQAMYSPQIYQSSSTAKLDRPSHQD